MVYLGDLTLKGFKSRRDDPLKLGAILPTVCVEQGDCVSVLARHRVRSDVLDVRDQQVAVLWPANRGGVDVLHHEPEHVLVPLEDEVPQVPLEEVLCPIEEGSRRLNWGHKVN